ncbi:DUF1963 domain-containing protein [Singulisphaera sp. PoT]|uniref:DUF1963 domain-containing protein n=1 Tax=Singulisphaera sp. PoT TaxID=3411797 RepID=UPI003BF4F453
MFDWSGLDALVPQDEGISLVATTTPKVSRLGGDPEFVAEWPQGEGGPLPFLGQFDFGELSAASGKHWPRDFPREGVLSIFYNEDDLASSLPASDRRHWAILFDEGRTRRVASHGPDKARYQSMWVRATTRPPRKAQMHRIGGMPDRIQYFNSFACGHFESGEYLRYPETVEALKEAGVAEDVFVRDYTEIVRAGHQLDEAGIAPSRFAQGLKYWSLLLQIDHDPRIGLSLADAGRLFIFGDRNTLRPGSQPSAWLELEYH